MSSFRKRFCQEPGIRTSPKTGQVITSSGNLSLDQLLGGGLPLGSICLIEEDKYVTHSKVLAKYFLAEGIVNTQAIFLGSLDDEPAELFKKLPKALEQGEAQNAEQLAEDKSNLAEQASSGGVASNGLRIAWRYNDLPVVNSEPASVTIGHHYNLKELMDSSKTDAAYKTFWNGALVNNDDDGDNAFELETEEDEVNDHVGMQAEDSNNLPPPPPSMTADDNTNSPFNDVQMQNAPETTQNLKEMPMDLEHSNGATTSNNSSSSPAGSTCSPKPQIFANSHYLSILLKLQPLLSQPFFSLDSMNAPRGAKIHKSLCRICITSLGSPLWYEENFAQDILKFMTVLRSLVKSARTVCFITMPMHLVAKCDESLVPKIRNLVDYAIELESFAGSERETNPAFKEYNGLLHLRKVTAINSLSPFMPETTDLGFKLRRTCFVINKLHLPPELQETENSAAPLKNNMSCSELTQPFLAKSPQKAAALAASALDF